jgi:Cu(I)/Ag(I) efflux system protein CusF
MLNTSILARAVVIAALVASAPVAAFADGVLVKGEITKVDPDTGKITIKHEPINKFDMDSMTMVFRAGDPAMLRQVKPGDQIRFHPDKVNGQLTVTRLETAK